jgi:hypothetical protein
MLTMVMDNGEASKAYARLPLSVSFLLRMVYRSAEFSRQSNRSGHTCRAFGADSSLRSRVRLVANGDRTSGSATTTIILRIFRPDRVGRIFGLVFVFHQLAAPAQPSVEVGRVYFVTISTPLWLVDVWDC